MLAGWPTPSLIRILTHTKAVFIGKQIQEDIDKLCEILKLSPQQRRQIKTIELTTVYIFCRMLAKSPASLKSWVRHPITSKDYSLKFIYNFSDEESTIDKRGEMRWRTVRWDESPFPAKPGQDGSKRKGRPLNMKNKIYAVTDAEASRLALINIFDKLKIRPSYLIQLMDSPYFLFQNEFAELIDVFNGNNKGRSGNSEALNLASVEEELKERVDKVELAEFIKRERRRRFRILKKRERGEMPHTPIYWPVEEKETQDEYEGGFGEKEEKRLLERETEKWYEKEREKVIEREKKRKENLPKDDEWDEGNGWQEVEEVRNEWSMDPRDIRGSEDARQVRFDGIRQSRQPERCQPRSRSRTPLSRRSSAQSPAPRTGQTTPASPESLTSTNRMTTMRPNHPLSTLKTTRRIESLTTTHSRTTHSSRSNSTSSSFIRQNYLTHTTRSLSQSTENKISACKNNIQIPSLMSMGFAGAPTVHSLSLTRSLDAIAPPPTPLMVHADQTEVEEILGKGTKPAKSKEETKAPARSGKGLGSPRVATPAAQVDAQRLREIRLTGVERLVERIKSKKGKQSCRYFLEILKTFRKLFKSKKDRRRLYHVGKVMIAALSGIPLREFVNDMLRENAISDDYIRAVNQLHQYRVDPFIVLDYMAQPTVTKKALTDFVGNLPRGKVIEVVRLAARMVEMPSAEKKEVLQGLSCFPSDYLEGVDMSLVWSPVRVKVFVQSICVRLGIPEPEEVKCMKLNRHLEGQSRRYLQGTVEDEDFLNMLELECGEDRQLWERAIQFTANKCLSLGQLVAHTCGLPAPLGDSNTLFTPACSQPFNRPLHELASSCKEVLVVRSRSHTHELAHKLRESRSIALLTHIALREFPHGGETDLMMVRTAKRIFAIFPRIFPELLAEIGDVLHQDAERMTIFVHGAEKLLPFFETLWNWKPKVIDLTEICAERGWKSNFDLLTEKVVGGTFCRRGTVFGGDVLPSSQVLRHRSITVSLIFEFGLRFWRSPYRRKSGDDRKRSQQNDRDRSPLRRY